MKNVPVPRLLSILWVGFMLHTTQFYGFLMLCRTYTGSYVKYVSRIVCAISNRLERKLNRQLRTLAPEKSWLQSPSKWSEGELWKVKKIRLANPNLGMEENPGKKIEEDSNENWRGRGRQGGNKKNFPRGGRGRTPFMSRLADTSSMPISNGLLRPISFCSFIFRENRGVLCQRSVTSPRNTILKMFTEQRLCARENCITLAVFRHKRDIKLSCYPFVDYMTGMLWLQGFSSFRRQSNFKSNSSSICNRTNGIRFGQRLCEKSDKQAILPKYLYETGELHKSPTIVLH